MAAGGLTTTEIGERLRACLENPLVGGSAVSLTEDHVIAEIPEATREALGHPVGIAPIEVGRAEVLERSAAADHVVDDAEDGMADGHERSPRTTSSGQPTVLGTQVGVG